MEKVLVHITELRNQTNQEIEFEVENRYFHLRASPPGKKRHVKLWKVLQACRKHNSPKWKIRFMMNKEFSGLEINANLLLYYARIIIKLESVGDGTPYLPYLEAIPEKPIDRWLRLKYIGCPRDRYWDKRPSSRIWPDPTWAKNLRVVEAQSPLQLAVPVANPSLLQRMLYRELTYRYRAQRPWMSPFQESTISGIDNYGPKGRLQASTISPNLLGFGGSDFPYESKDCRSIEELPTEGESNEIKTNASPLPEEPAGPAAGLSSPEREKKVIAAAYQQEEHGPPKREKIRMSPDRKGCVEELERGSGGNMPELPQEKEDDDLRSSIKCKDMEKTVQLMLLVIAFICVLLFKFLVWNSRAYPWI